MNVIERRIGTHIGTHMGTHTGTHTHTHTHAGAIRRRAGGGDGRHGRNLRRHALSTRSERDCVLA
jgi:hypothetical protein